MARAFAFVVCALMLLGTACSDAEIERNLDEIAASAQRAYDDLATAVDEAVGGLDDDAAQAVEHALATAEDARAALADFAENPGDESRRALREAESRVEDARRGLEDIGDSVPEGVRGAFDRVVSSFAALAEEIRRALDRG